MKQPERLLAVALVSLAIAVCIVLPTLATAGVWVALQMALSAIGMA